ncbi:hypothetical protein HYH03_009471 [Edaphochlamys debaryana]|uniref:Thioesterase domain-containing protein n=1 Tax=Edaphochlamys debaryana TaxID=47281 RepID=A0A835XXY1_9CHLO|nr:hypothetical protein HYH03_009471 [Edaphochlamys debaryana]|eukprot:KAG2492226.1 hypothetical protein HYH03_009471 [Edaphochlamys debaryana]
MASSQDCAGGGSPTAAAAGPEPQAATAAAPAPLLRPAGGTATQDSPGGGGGGPGEGGGASASSKRVDEDFGPWVLRPPRKSPPPASAAAAGATDRSGLSGGAGCGAQVLLYCIPQAGMGAYVYHPWEQALAERGVRVEVLALELPGRNSRLREPCAGSLLALAGDIAGVVARVQERRGWPPYAVFGHSMGGWIAYEVVQALMRTGMPLPVHVFVSGIRAPHLYAAADDPDPTRLHALPSCEAFWAAFTARYGSANPHLAHPAIRERLWPVLRADFRLTETYQLPPTNPPLSVPVTVVGGERDARYTREQLEAWRRHVGGPCAVVWLAGAGHDYVERGAAVVLEAVVAALRGALERGAELGVQQVGARP